MKIVTYTAADSRRLAFQQADWLIDPLLALAPDDEARQLFRDATTFIASGSEGLVAARTIIEDAPRSARLALADCNVVAPILPSSILASGSNYRSHNAEKANTPISGKEPEFFVMTSDCVVGPNEPIIYDPELTEKLDIETELAIVIGAAGRHIPVERALDHVFGYTIADDVTARDRQVRRSPEGTTWYELGRSKAFDTSLALGPCIVTADEIGDPQDLHLTTHVNGELRQSASTAEMIWSCAELVHFFSINFTLKPGMVIITGTPAGTAWTTDLDLGGSGNVAAGLTPAKRYCLPGDVVENTVDKIGTLRNAIVHIETM